MPEAAWLYVLAATPVLFSLNNTRNFDFVKTLYIRGAISVVVLVVAVGWTLSMWLERSRDETQSPLAWRDLDALRQAACVAAIIVLGALALATTTSLVPRISLVGSHLRNFGLYTEGVHVVLFLSLVFGLRTSRQLRRVFDVICATGLVLVLHAALQLLNADPLDIAFIGRGGALAGLTGNSLFYAGFLVTAVMVNGGRLLSLLESDDEADTGAGFDLLVAGVLGLGALLLLVNVALRLVAPWWVFPALPLIWCVLFAGATRIAPSWWSRRHDVAVYGLLFVVQLALVFRTGSRTAWVAVAAAILVFGLITVTNRRVRLAIASLSFAILLFTALILATNVVGSPQAALREVPGVGSVLQAAGQRLTVQGRWEIWRELLTLMSQSRTAAQPLDRLADARQALGLGPGTLYVMMDRFVTQERLRVEGARIDRAHNEMLERFSSGGALGAVAWVAFLASLIALAIAGARRAARGVAPRWAAGAAAAALVGHIATDAFGPGDPTTRIYFWFVAGLVASAAVLEATGVPGSAPTAVPAVVPPLGRSARRARQAQQAAPSSSRRSPLLGTRLIATLGLALFVVGAALLASLPPTPERHGAWLFATSALVVLLLLAVAAVLAGFDIRAFQVGRRDLAMVAPLFLAGTLLFWLVVRPYEADVYNRHAVQATARGQAPVGIELSRWAIAISPNEELYYMTLAAAFGDIAQVAPARQSALPSGSRLQQAIELPLQELPRLSRDDYLALSQAAFERARQLNPYDVVHEGNLARLHALRAQLVASGSTILELATAPLRR